MKRESGVVVGKGLLVAALGLSMGPIHAIAFSSAFAADPGAQAKTHTAVAALPLNFEENLGQASSTGVQYLARGAAYSIALGQQGAVLSLRRQPRSGPKGPKRRSSPDPHLAGWRPGQSSAARRTGAAGPN
jgi:hypothetical protein